MSKKKILFIGGSLNQTTIMHQISKFLDKEYDCYFAPFYADKGYLKYLKDKGLLEFSIFGGVFRGRSLKYMNEKNLKVDEEGKNNDYDLVLLPVDLYVPYNIRNKPILLVQEGMTDPENFFYYLVKWFKFPRWMASTSAFGLSDVYQKFCVASEGYKELFIKKGVKEEKIVITGIPNFDNMKKYLDNDFPLNGYVLVATSDMRETFKYDNRKKFLKKCAKIAKGRQIIFKLHPNEKFKRAKKEIEKYAPGSLIFREGNTEEMIANCEVLITQFSSVVYVGLALGKECYSYFDMGQLKKLLPDQNGGKSSENIANVCRSLLEKKIGEYENSYCHSGA